MFTQQNNLNLWVQTPLAIKKSPGLTRVKTDKVDAHHIAQYPHRYQDLQRIHDIITSIDGVGTITVTYFIWLTEGFTKLNDPRTLACYAGVTPFEHTSGTSIKDKSSVSPFANKELKSLLLLCTLSLLKMKNTFTDFIERKKVADKHMMSILNALKNKLLHTICACIRENEQYKKTISIHLYKP